MRKVLLGAALTAAMVTPGLASADTTGSISLGLENTEYDSGSDFDAYSLGATLMHDLSGGMTVQAEGRTILQDWGTEYSHGHAAVHLSSDAGAWDFGGFAGLINYYGEGGFMLGGEVRTSFGNFSADGSITYADFLDNGLDGLTYRLDGAYFFTPNFAINGGYAYSDISSSLDYEITEYSIGGAYQFANGIALTGGYTNSEYDNPGSDNEADTFQIGVRFNFGGGTLQDNVNDGAWTSAEHASNTWARW